MIEVLLIVSLLFCVNVFFYKQTRSDLTILQLEESQIEAQLSDLLTERQPLILRGVSPPKGLTLEALQKIERLANFPVGSHPFSAILQSPQMLAQAKGLPVLNQEGREQLSEELSVPVWASHQWLPRLNQTTWLGWAIGSIRSEVILGGLGLFKTTALTTCIFPTEGKYNVSIVVKESEDYLPAASWQYRYPSSFTINDTPLVSDLKYLDIVLRPGTALCIPPHTYISLEPAPDSTPFQAAVLVEYHEPISLVTKMLRAD